MIFLRENVTIPSKVLLGLDYFSDLWSGEFDEFNATRDNEDDG